MMTPTDLCSLCGLDQEWHKKHKPHHAFVKEGGSLEEAEYGEPDTRPRQMPFDPVLRFLLVQKGIISADELTSAEAQLRATGLLVTPPPTPEEPTSPQAWKE